MCVCVCVWGGGGGGGGGGLYKPYLCYKQIQRGRGGEDEGVSFTV